MSKGKTGSVLGGTLLTAGSCIGAGMLALPIFTGLGGFFPSCILFVVAWLFMTLTGFLLMEVNLSLGHHMSLISLARRTLGKPGQLCTWILFLFLFYSLSVAYISASGLILSRIVQDLLLVTLSPWMGSVLFTALFAVILMVGTRPVDLVNRGLMLGLFLSYGALVLLGSRHVHLTYLAHQSWSFALISLPTLVVSFGFHNMIPSLAMYFEGDVKRLRWTLILGSALPLFIYLIWDFVMLGLIPDATLFAGLDSGEVATSLLHSAVQSVWVQTMAQSFALFAIITSFLAQSLSLVDFLADGLKIVKVGSGRMTLIFLTLFPPFVMAFLYPGVFLRAINLAGGISAVLLFGVMPALMVWKLRYHTQVSLSPLLPAGRPLLVVILLIALGIFSLELAQELGWSPIPSQVEAAP